MRAFFAQALVKYFEHVGVEVLQWCCSAENHKEGGTHYQVAMKLRRVTRWIGSKKYLKERHGITVHYSDKNLVLSNELMKVELPPWKI